jgi:hypothetical protein
MNVVKALPPLVISEQEVRRFAAALEDVIASAQRMPSAMMRLGWGTFRRAASRRRRSLA